MSDGLKSISAESGGFTDPTSPITTWYAPSVREGTSVSFKAVISNGIYSTTQTFWVTITDQNMLPEFAYLDADPIAGECPMEVSFQCLADDPDGHIQTYSWDFDGDGVYDSETATCQATYVYFEDGTYMPRVTATDDRGDERIGNFSVISVKCEVPEGELSLACNPSSGPTGTTITFVGYQWPAGSEIEISFDNEVVVTSVTANAQGSFTATWTVPSGTSSGSKHVVANVIGSVTVWSETDFIVE